jgi:hypothetical protein
MSENKIQKLLKQADSIGTPYSSVNYARRDFSDASGAAAFFDKLKLKFFRIEEWNSKAGVTSYELFDKNGKVAHEKNIAEGDFIRITLPGSGKDDWVKIINIHETEDEVVLTVQPSFNPTEKKPDAETVTSHFFTDESTNNFCFQRENKIVSFYVIGLNEKSNTEDTKGALETVRNFATSNLGYFLGIQKGEWTTFCRNFLEIEDKDN